MFDGDDGVKAWWLLIFLASPTCDLIGVKKTNSSVELLPRKISGQEETLDGWGLNAASVTGFATAAMWMH